MCNENADMMAEGFEKAKPLTRQEVENYILLKTQSGERWYEMRFLDEEMQSDPTAQAFMAALSDGIFAGIVTASLEERMVDAEGDKKYLKGDLNGTATN